MGVDNLYDCFTEYLLATKRTAASVQKTDAEVSEFVDWFFQRQEEEQGLDEDADFDVEAVEGGDPSDAWGVAPTDEELSDEESGDEDEVQEEHQAKKGKRVFLDLVSSSDEEGDGEGSEPGGDDIDMIECSSDEDGSNWPSARQPSRLAVAQPKSHTQQAQLNKFFPKLPLATAPLSDEGKAPAAAEGPGSRHRTPLQQLLGQENRACNRPATAEEAALDDLAFANKMVFGNAAFRPRQRDIVQAVLSKRDTFVLMPTGGGKSLCYQLPAVLLPGVTVVVTPLLSLMQDQVQALCTLPGGGVPATYISSQQSESEKQAVRMELAKARPTVKLLYVTPEQFVKAPSLQNSLRDLHRRGLFALLVVDECHCVSQWGHGELLMTSFYSGFLCFISAHNCS